MGVALYAATVLMVLNASACRRSAEIVSVEVTPDTVIQAPGDTMRFSVTVLDETLHVVTNAELNWGSTDSSVVTISDEGAAASRATGSAMIQATVSGVTGRALVTVLDRDAIPRWSTDVMPAIAQTCVSGNCHNAANATLDLSTNPYDALMASPALRNPAFDRVLPYEPDLSWLLLEFTDSISDVVNPTGNHHTGVSRPSLPLIRRWIQAGARDH